MVVAKAKLKRDLTLFEATIYGVGIIFGAGIYALIGETIGIAGTAAWVSFVIAAIIASFTGLSYAELSARFPKEAAEYIYTKKAFKNEYISFIVGWLGIIAGIISAAVVALGFAGYFLNLTKLVISPIIVGTALIILLSTINFWGIKESSKFNVAFTIMEVTGLILIIILGMRFFGSVDYFDFSYGSKGILSATALIFFAYIGFEEVANISEETKDAVHTIPRALIYAILITTTIYILVSISAVSVLGTSELLTSSGAPLANVALIAGSPMVAKLMSIIALFATSNTVLVILIVTSRMMYGMAENGSLPKILSKIHAKRGTPYISVALMTIVSLSFLLFRNIRTIAEIVNLSVFLVFFAINMSLIYIRHRERKGLEPTSLFRAPVNIGNFPVLAFLGAVISIFMITRYDKFVWMICGIILIIGTILYLIVDRNKRKA